MPLKPVIRWIGGKRLMLSHLNTWLASGTQNNKIPYYEPFVGGGACLFHLCPKEASINDKSSELMNFYYVLEWCPKQLLQDLYTIEWNEEKFYQIRDSHPIEEYDRAFRFFVISVLGFRGLQRFNQSGKCTTAFGKLDQLWKIDLENFMSVSKYISAVKLNNLDFEDFCDRIKTPAFVFLDPPYETTYTMYTSDTFTPYDQVRLMKCCKRMDDKGIRWLMTSCSIPSIKTIYKDFNQFEVASTIQISKQTQISEIIITNWRE